jgi:hypothetical protein
MELIMELISILKGDEHSVISSHLALKRWQGWQDSNPRPAVLEVSDRLSLGTFNAHQYPLPIPTLALTKHPRASACFLWASMAMELNGVIYGVIYTSFQKLVIQLLFGRSQFLKLERGKA